jgi:hypothetical protein
LADYRPADLAAEMVDMKAGGSGYVVAAYPNTSTGSTTPEDATHIWAKQAKDPTMQSIVGKCSRGGISPLAFKAKLA